MKKLAVLILFIACATGARMQAQIAAEPTKASRVAPEKKAKKTATDKKNESAGTGDVELRGTPRVQAGLNMHVATSPDTVMIINQNSQLTTPGPSRTEIRQQPNEEKKGEASPSQTSPAQTPPAPALPKP